MAYYIGARLLAPSRFNADCNITPIEADRIVWRVLDHTALPVALSLRGSREIVRLSGSTGCSAAAGSAAADAAVGARGTGSNPGRQQAHSRRRGAIVSLQSGAAPASAPEIRRGRVATTGSDAAGDQGKPPAGALGPVREWLAAHTRLSHKGLERWSRSQAPRGRRPSARGSLRPDPARPRRCPSAAARCVMQRVPMAAASIRTATLSTTSRTRWR